MSVATEAQQVLCEQTVTRFYLGVDTSNYDDVLACVGPSSVWRRKGEALIGPEAIQRALEQRIPGRTTCHQVSNVLVDLESAGVLAASYYLSVYDNQGPGGTLQLKAILRSIDRYSIEGDSLRLIEKGSTRHLS